MYTAYSYTAENGDELSFENGDCLKVQSREDRGPNEEKYWWWCLNERTGMEGYAPRNYLGVRPRLALQNDSTRDLEIFELPPSGPNAKSDNMAVSQLKVGLEQNNNVGGSSMQLSPTQPQYSAQIACT